MLDCCITSFSHFAHPSSDVRLKALDILALPLTLTSMIGSFQVDWSDCKSLELMGEQVKLPPSLILLSLYGVGDPAHCQFLPSTLTRLDADIWQRNDAGSRALNSISFPSLKSQIRLAHFLSTHS